MIREKISITAGKFIKFYNARW